MAKMIEIDWNPEEETLRQFGWVALVGFGLLALMAWQRWLIFAALGDSSPTVAGTLLGLGVLAALIGLVHPKANKWLFLGLTILAFPIGFVLSHVIMFTLFFLIIAPIGIAIRLVGRDPMNRTIDPDAETYWTPAEPTPPNARYFKQF